MKKLTNPTQEFWTELYAEEVKAAGYIDEYVLHPVTFSLYEGLKRPYTQTKVLYKGTPRERERTEKKIHTILNGVSYTPDALIKWNPKAKGIFFVPFDSEKPEYESCYFKAQWSGEFWFTLIDVKAPTGTNRHSDAPFVFTQKWLYANTGQYVQKVMNAPAKVSPKSLGYLFQSTFTPERYLYTDKLTKMKSNLKHEVRTLKQFIKLKTSTSK